MPSLCCNVEGSSPNIRKADFVREMTTMKPRKYGEYRSFEHLLFMFLLKLPAFLRQRGLAFLSIQFSQPSLLGTNKKNSIINGRRGGGGGGGRQS